MLAAESLDLDDSALDDSGFDLNERLLEAEEAFLNHIGDVSRGADDVFDFAAQ